MSESVYVVTVQGLVPAYLSRKVIEAHAEAVESQRWLETSPK